MFSEPDFGRVGAVLGTEFFRWPVKALHIVDPSGHFASGVDVGIFRAVNTKSNKFP